MSINILDVIKSIRDSFIGAKELYLNGGCYKFAEILKSIFPEGEICIYASHAIFKYQNEFYDITGIVEVRLYYAQTKLELSREYVLENITEHDYTFFEKNQISIAYNQDTIDLIFQSKENEFNFIKTLLNSELQMFKFNERQVKKYDVAHEVLSKFKTTLLEFHMATNMCLYNRVNIIIKLNGGTSVSFPINTVNKFENSIVVKLNDNLSHPVEISCES